MKNSEAKNSEVEQAGEDLFNFVVDREDIKWLMSHLSEAADIKRETVEYELQILKIISVGWSISYYLENSPHKRKLLDLYWKAVHDFSQTISTATGQLIGQDIDYFQILKDLSLIHISEPTRPPVASRMPSSA